MIADFQTLIGHADVKSSLVHFYAQSTTSFSTVNTPVPFNVAKLNTGSALNLSTEKFTAPVAGTYFFTFAGDVDFPTPGFAWMHVALVLNGNTVGIVQSNSNGFGTLSIHSTLHLQVNDQVWVKIDDKLSDPYLRGGFYHFTGSLLDQDVF